MTKRKINGQRLSRSFPIEPVKIRAEDDEDSREVEIAFSSDTDELERWFGIEQLVHDKGSVRLDRLNNAGAVLVNHDTDDQVGVVQEARIDKDGKGRAVIRFSRSVRGEEIFNDVMDGIRQLVSVGYMIHGYEVEERAGQADLFRITDWEPMEVSIVAVPADVSVGVGRSIDYEEAIQMGDQSKGEGVQPEPTPTPEPTVDTSKVRGEAVKAERDRINKIRSMAERNELEELGRQAMEEGWDYAKFNERALEEIGKRNNQARAESKHDGEVDLDHKEQRRYSLLNVMNAVANPQDREAQKRAAFELEVSDEAVKGFGPSFNARGIYIPESVLSRALAAGTATEAAELVATNLLAGSFIETLRNSSTMILAGATMLPGLVGNVDIPRQTSGASMTWISAEDGDATESEPAFDQVSLTPKDAALYTEMTRRALMQSTPAIDGIVRRDMAMAVALGIDSATLYGTGATGQPTGIVNQTGINNPTFAAADPTYAELINMIRLVMDDNALTGVPSWIFGADGWEALSTTPKQASGVEGNFIMPEDRVKGYQTRVSTQVTAGDYFFGDWSQVLIGEWGGLEINVDPYTHSLKGRVRFVAFKTMDIAVRHAESFCLGNDTI